MKAQSIKVNGAGNVQKAKTTNRINTNAMKDLRIVILKRKQRILSVLGVGALFVVLVAVSLFGLFAPDTQPVHKVMALCFLAFAGYLCFHIMPCFSHVELMPKKITVYLRDGTAIEYKVPETIKKISFDSGYVWVDLDNDGKRMRLSDRFFSEKDIFKQWLTENIPIIRCYKDGRIEKASFLDGNTGKDSVMIIGSVDPK